MKKSQPLQALAEALREPPHTGSDAVKDIAAQALLKALAGFKEADVKGAVASLGDEEQKAMMKYLYKFWGMALPQRTNSSLFAWHNALVEQGGECVIVRAMYDWKWP